MCCASNAIPNRAYKQTWRRKSDDDIVQFDNEAQLESRRSKGMYFDANESGSSVGVTAGGKLDSFLPPAFRAEHLNRDYAY